MNPEATPEQKICDNPIGALNSGMSPRKVAETLRVEGWTEGEIAKLFEKYTEFKSQVI